MLIGPSPPLWRLAIFDGGQHVAGFFSSRDRIPIRVNAQGRHLFFFKSGQPPSSPGPLKVRKLGFSTSFSLWSLPCFFPSLSNTTLTALR